MGQMEEIEFRVFADGRIEETVRGVKGEQCLSITQDINSMLGDVTATKPTEEMFEEKIKIEQTVENKQESGGSWKDDSTW